MVQQFGENFNLNNIYIILVRPQMGENIGAVARVMLNFNLQNLRIVSPRDGWPNEKAKKLSVGASHIIEQAQIYDNFYAAISDVHLVYAATARPRYMNKPVLFPEDAAIEIMSTSNKIAIVIGPESSGLNNREIAIANKIITIKVNPQFSSINIAQATGIICYELYKKVSIVSDIIDFGQLATHKEITEMLNHLEQELDQRNFYRVPDKKEGMVNNLRSMFKRINNLTSQDVKTFRGIIKCLTGEN